MGERRVLFLEGEALIGAKQNRVLNTSVLVGAHSSTLIRVSCVEAGRWRHRTRRFAHSDGHSSSKLRYLLKSSTRASLARARGHASDQGAVWGEVARALAAHGSRSDTVALIAAYEQRENDMRDFLERLRCVENAVGVAVGVGERIVAVDVFDKPKTCAKVWNRLLTGVILDALEQRTTEASVQAEDVLEFLSTVATACWEPVSTVGEGQELRSSPAPSIEASALTFQDSWIHCSVMAQN